jgi:DUF1365 family protein
LDHPRALPARDPIRRFARTRTRQRRTQQEKRQKKPREQRAHDAPAIIREGLGGMKQASQAPAPAEATAVGIYAGSVMHLRLRPRRHLLRYRMFSLLVDIDALPDLAGRLRWLSLNRFNLFALHERDHGEGAASGLAGWVRRQLRDAGLAADGVILLLTMPRILGYVFNPLSVYFCHDATGDLQAILYEVNNTFGERHGYLLEVAPGQRDGQRVHQACAKRLHVSPFLEKDLRYRFRVRPPRAGTGRCDLTVDVLDQAGLLLVTQYDTRRRDLDDAGLLRMFFACPLLTLKVIAGIHFEALRLWLKGAKVFTKPAGAPPAVTVLKIGS